MSEIEENPENWCTQHDFPRPCPICQRDIAAKQFAFKQMTGFDSGNEDDYWCEIKARREEDGSLTINEEKFSDAD